MDEAVIVVSEKSDKARKPPGADKPEKKLKREVSYGRGTRQAHCGICAHFHWPSIEESVSEGTCDVVTGTIEPARWCDQFTKDGKAKKDK